MKNEVFKLSIKIGSILGLIQMVYLFCTGILIPDLDNLSENTQTILDTYVFFILTLFIYLLVWGFKKYKIINGSLSFFKGLLIGITSVFIFLCWVSIYNSLMYNLILNEKLPITYSHLRSFDFGLNIFEFVIFSFIVLVVNSFYFFWSKLITKYF